MKELCLSHPADRDQRTKSFGFILDPSLHINDPYCVVAKKYQLDQDIKFYTNRVPSF